MRTLKPITRTKTETREAIKRGERVELVNHDGKVLPYCNGGPWHVAVQLDHYKAWTAEVTMKNGAVIRIK